MAGDQASRGRRLGVGLAVGALAGALTVDLNLAAALSIWGDPALLVPVAAVVGGVLWPTRLRPALAMGAAFLAVLWLAVAFTPLSRGLAEGLVRKDPPGPAEAVLVLGSRIQADGDPTVEAESRLLRGLELLAEGLAPRLILTEQPEPATPYAPIARRLMKTFRLEQELLTVGPIRNTHEEAVAVARLYRERGWRRLLVVTSPTHTRRACATVEHEGIEVVCAPSLETRLDLESLDRPLDRIALFGQVLHEHLGEWVYRRKGWLGPTSR